MDWYAVQVKPQHEKAAERRFHDFGREAFLPLYRTRRRWSDRIKELELPLFPGYVFCRFGSDEKAAVLSVPGVRSIVTFGRIPAPIPGAEIEAVQAILRAGVPVRPWPGLEIGRQVRVESGPLRGVQGVLLRFKSTWQVLVSIELLRRSVIAEVDLAAVFPARL